jgi:hypothetical protein
VTDTIGGYDLHMVETYSQSGRVLTLSGHHDTAVGRLSLEELFRDAETGSAQHKVPGSNLIGEDLSDDERYTQLLYIPSQSKVITGFYILLSYSKGGDDYETSTYAWRLQLLFIGTTGTMTRGYDLTGADEVTSDWGI